MVGMMTPQNTHPCFVTVTLNCCCFRNHLIYTQPANKSVLQLLQYEPQCQPVEFCNPAGPGHSPRAVMGKTDLQVLAKRADYLQR